MGKNSNICSGNLSELSKVKGDLSSVSIFSNKLFHIFQIT